jgi:hypothetical protein
MRAAEDLGLMRIARTVFEPSRSAGGFDSWKSRPNSTKGEKRMNNPDAARQQAQRDHDWNHGAPNTNTSDATSRQAYEAERARLQKQQQESSNKSSGS